VSEAAACAEDAPLALIGLDADLQLRFANTSAEALLGRSVAGLKRRSLQELTPWGAAIADAARRAIAADHPVIAHEVTPDEAASDLKASIDAAPSAGGAVVVVRVWPAAVSRRRDAAAATAAAGFGRLLSHELKNPIAGARGAAQLLLQGGFEEEEAADLARLIIGELDRARRIAERWAQVGDIAPQPFQAVNMQLLARDAVRSAAAAAPGAVTLEERYDPSLPDAAGDRDLLLQAILNLIVNAIEAIGRRGGEGRVIVSTRYRTAAGGDPHPEARLEIAIEDDGPGVPDPLREHLFNPFVTEKPAGEGLGLAFVSRIAAMHDGAVRYESAAGRTVFRLQLRLWEEKP